MNDESKQLLGQLVELQKEQTELLRKYLPPLWTRIRFSLFALLFLMTFVAAGLGFTVMTIKSLKPSVTTTPTMNVPTGNLFSNPVNSGPTLETVGTFSVGQPSQPIIDPPKLDAKK